MCSPFYVVAIGKVRAKVPAAAFLPAQRRARDEQADRDDAAHAAEVCVGEACRRRGANQRAVEPNRTAVVIVYLGMRRRSSQSSAAGRVGRHQWSHHQPQFE